jgi:hypothetical protein
LVSTNLWFKNLKVTFMKDLGASFFK